MPTVRDQQRSNTDQLRHDIDRGRTGDKVPWPDPALAPLGTDDEAAGTPPSPRDVDIARRAERRGPEHARPDAGLGYAWILIAFILVLLAGVIAWFIMTA
jgi:hypothetical protein